ncbi:MAG: carboxypeptidase regulatory-like domain-containing protein [Vicinamibacterales bacterium]
MSRRPRIVLVLTFLLVLGATAVDAQVRTTGQIVGTIRDPSGAVVPDAEVQIRDLATGITAETKSARDGAFVFVAVQPGRYTLTAVAKGFQPVVIETLNVETARATNVTLQAEVAGVQEAVTVEGRSPVIEMSSTTISTTVGNAVIEKLPMGGRSVLVFALLIPGAQQNASRTAGTTSPSARDSHINGLPGGAINITLDGVNNNSERFRSGGTSLFTFAPTRLGAMEEVTVSTAGLTADGGAQGAVQIQFVTKRGTNLFHGQVFDDIQNERFNANTPVNNARGVPKPRIRQHEFGFNLGGPLIRNRLFFFGNYEQIHVPGQTVLNRTVLTQEATQGIFRYVATDGSVRTANLLQIAAANGFQGTIDPVVGRQLQLINNSLSGGNLTSQDLIRSNLSFTVPTQPLVNIYPTARVDFQAAQNLSIRGVLNAHWRDLAQNPQFPNMDRIGGFTSTYYILSTGADWTPRQDMVNQFSLGMQQNPEVYNKTNTAADYEAAGNRRITLPLNLTSAYLTGALRFPRNNPVFNVSNTLTWLKGRHTWTFGGTYRHANLWEPSGGEPETFTLGIAAGDPVSAIFNTTTVPGLRTADQTNLQALYALLTGRISQIAGVRNIDEHTKQYGLNQVVRREANQVGGVYAQDSFRWRQNVTLNYGLRWELTGAAKNTNQTYTAPTIADLQGPSTAPFRPGVLDGVTNPSLVLMPKPYKSDLLNFAPNVGAAWTLEPREGFWGRLLGRSVLRGNFGVNYYDEGGLSFSTAAGQNPGLFQNVSLLPGQPGFTPGGLSLSSALPPLQTNPASFSFPMAQSLFTFSRALATVDPDIRTPYILNWSIGFQREVWSDAAVEVRYLANAGRNLWRSYDLNEVNVFENGFLQDFQRAQRNLAINQAVGVSSFANAGLPGQAATPIFDAAFGARGGQSALPAASGYTNGTFITNLQQGQAGRLANSMASNPIYLCRMVGSSLSPCSTLGYAAPGVYPINVFQMNPYAAGNAVRKLTDEATSRYHSLQVQFRQRYRSGLTLTANYTYSTANTDRYADSASSVVDYFTLRDKRLNWGPDVYDVRSAFTAYSTYELPFGRDRRFQIGNAVLEHALGGWAVSTVVRLQTGRPFLLTSGRQTVNQQDSGVILNGITVKDLQKLVKVSPGPSGNVFFFDPKLIGADGRANPQYLSVPTTPGERGQYVRIYGPGLFDLDLSLNKQFRVTERVRANFQALLLTVLNTPSYLVGGTGGATLNIDSTTFGQTTNMGAGPRAVVLRLQVLY